MLIAVSIVLLSIQCVQAYGPLTAYKTAEAPLPAKVVPKPAKAIETPTEAPTQPVPQPIVEPEQPVIETTGDSAKLFIYNHESGNNPGAINKSSGACGLGQALPCSKMGCTLDDYGCQDAFFTSYMLARYGSWDNAEAF